MNAQVNARGRTQGAVRSRALRWVVMILVLCQLVIVPQGVAAQTDARPGEGNPAVAYAEWRDDEVFLGLPPLAENDQARLGIYAPNSAMTETVTADSQNFSTGLTDALAAGAGRILSPEHESAVYAQRHGADVGVSFFRPSTAQPVAVLPGLAPRYGTSSDFLDVSVGDLDAMPAGDTEYRDEVVVAYARPSADGRLPVTVAVLDFADASEAAPVPTAVTTAAAAGTLAAADIGGGGIAHGDGGLDSAVGDYDGDGAEEIAIAYLSGKMEITVDLFRYSVTVTNNVVQRALTRVGGTVVQVTYSPGSSSSYLHATVSLVMADFDGDNLDEAILATEGSFLSDPQVVPNHYNLAPLVYSLDITGGNPASIRVAHFTSLWHGQDLRDTHYGAVQLAPALLKVDPAYGWGLNRRQLVMAYFGPLFNGVPTVNVQSILVAADLSISLPLVWDTLLIPVSGPAARFALGTGGFAGALSSEHPTWNADLAVWDQNMLMHRYFQMAGNSIQDVGVQLIWRTQANAALGGRLALSPIDHDGDTVYLGAPVHLVIENLISTDFILEEPPKHVYWDAGLKTVANVSRLDGFNISLVQTDKTEFNTTTKDTTDWSIGSSVSASASATLGFNVNAGIAKESTELSVQASAKVGYDYQEHESEYTSSYADRTVSFTGVTSRDDYIVGKLQTLDVWRYRMYGMKSSVPGQYVYYDMVMPGAHRDLQTAAGGLSFDWYQPPHENGNLLSYPQFDGATFTPADLGQYTLPGSDQPIKALLLDPSQRAWDATSDTIALTFSSASGGGSERSYSHTLAENASVKATYKTSASLGGPKNNVSASFSATAETELHNKNSWGSSTTSNNKTSTSTGITLNKATGSAEKAYFFYPVMYVASDGTIKVTFAVDPLSHPTGRTWWAEQYGKQPDLALNLPLRFTTAMNEYGVVSWVPTKGMVRKQMRGFFVRKAEVNTVTGDHDLITTAVLDGEKVRLEARVYNYSLNRPVPTGAIVRFEAAPYDPGANEEGPRFLIGETTLPLMEPRKMVTAAVEWDTSTLTWEAGNEKHYRIYVLLDPSNQVPDEKYETESAASQTYCYKVSDAQPQVCIDPGQNNEGYGYVTVRRQLLGDPNWNDHDVDLAMGADGLSVMEEGGILAAGTVKAALGQPLDLRLTVHADKPSADFATVLLYDGDPAQGGALIAGKEIFAGSLEAAGGSAWVQWVPLTSGTHTLYAEVLESIHDPVIGNNVSTLQVEVEGWVVNEVIFLPMVGKQ